MEEPPLKKAKRGAPVRYTTVSTGQSQLTCWDDPARGVWGMRLVLG